MGQKQRIDQMLRRGPVCGTDLLDERMPRYAAVIHAMRGEGIRIATRRCANPTHRHRTPQVEYVLQPAETLF